MDAWLVVLILLSIGGAVMAKPAGTQGAPSKAVASAVAVVPQTIPSSQYHSQDEYGQYSYGYSNSDGQSKAEVKGIDGSIAGKYSYIDASGKRVEVSYIADDSGFHAVGDHFPSNNVPNVPASLANAYQEANSRLKEAYAQNQAMASASGENGSKKEKEEEGKEENGKEEEEEEEEEENGEEEKEKGKEEDSEEDSEESEKESSKDEKSKKTKSSSHVPVGPQTVIRNVQPVIRLSGHYAPTPVAMQAAGARPQVVYVARAIVSSPAAVQQPSVEQFARSAPVKSPLPIPFQRTTLQLIKPAPIRLLKHAFHTYVPDTSTHQVPQQQPPPPEAVEKQVVQHSIPIPVQQYTGQLVTASQGTQQFTIAPGYGYIPVQYSG